MIDLPTIFKTKNLCVSVYGWLTGRFKHVMTMSRAGGVFCNASTAAATNLLSTYVLVSHRPRLLVQVESRALTKYIFIQIICHKKQQQTLKFVLNSSLKTTTQSLHVQCKCMMINQTTLQQLKKYRVIYCCDFRYFFYR